MKRKYFMYAFLPAIFGFGLVGVTAASAHGLGWGNASPEEFATRQQTMFQNQADMLGISIEDIKAAWADGKTLPQLAKEKGISDEQLKTKMKEAHLQKMKTHLQALVDKGVVTQAQADKHLQVTQDHLQQKGKGHKGMGFHGGWQFGM